MIEKEKAILVDIRYPTDFAGSHIDGAINLSLRRMPTEVMNEHIAKLPKRPIILPCYDRRGCFFAEVLGYELTKAGHDVRGRYTLPWEYFIARGRPPHVENWIAENNKGVFAKSAHYVAGAMSAVSQWTGVVAVIALLALISRLLVLPFSLKAERDQIRAREAADELESLKSRLKDDPVRRTHAIRGFYKRHGITPARNLLALAFLPVMAVALLAVQELAAQTEWGLPLDCRPRLSRSVVRSAACLRSADHALRRSCLCNQREAQGPDLDRHPAADDGNRYAVQCRRRHLSDRQRCAAAGPAALGQRSVRTTLAGLAPQPDARGHHRI